MAKPLFSFWLRGLDLNQRPSGYEPDELPDCSTPRQGNSEFLVIVNWCLSGLFSVHGRPGDDLLSHALRRSTIGAKGFHFRVRDGIGCRPLAMTTRSSKTASERMNKPNKQHRNDERKVVTTPHSLAVPVIWHAILWLHMVLFSSLSSY